MGRYFNVAGPCNPQNHYMLPATSRCSSLEPLIEKGQYFIVYGARQTGKTTFLQDVAKTLTAGGKHIGLYCSLETAQGFNEPAEGVKAIVNAMRKSIEFHPALFGLTFAGKRDLANVSTVLQMALTDLCLAREKPLTILFDEVDCLGGETKITFLRQLRDGFINRASIPFAHSIGLAGMRNIRDYQAKVPPEDLPPEAACPYNIATEIVTPCPFTRDDIAALYAQHTADTGQAFPPEAVETAFHYSQGQPWLINALAREVVEKILGGDPSRAIAPALFDEAAARLMRRRDTHLDNLLERLKEPPVERILTPVLTGEGAIEFLGEDYAYTHALGLVREENGVARPANPIYGEAIARTLTNMAQLHLPETFIHRWMDEETIDLTGMLQGFQAYWRENRDAMTAMIPYKDAARPLALQAFVQRVLGNEASIARAYASNSHRVAMCIERKEKRYPVAMKTHRGQSAGVRAEGVEQLSAYMDTLGQTEGWLAIFDQRPEISWDEKTYWEDVENDGKTLHIIGL